MTQGIYVIQNLASGEQYVGSSIRIEERWRYHLYDMRAGRSNPKLQRAFHQYGEGAFVCIVLEEVERRTQLDEREQYYINTHQPAYNMRETASRSLSTDTFNDPSPKAPGGA